MTSCDYRLNPLYPIKECSSCGALYTTGHCCSVGILGDNIICDLDKTPDLSQRSPQNCSKCGNPVNGHYCQGCAFLRKKFKEDLFVSCVETEYFKILPSHPMTIPTLLMLIESHSLSIKTPVKTPHKVLHESIIIVVTVVVPIILDPEPYNNQTIKELPPTVQARANMLMFLFKWAL
nr:hypothetical protein [Tanacetum cinerariifolium]